MPAKFTVVARNIRSMANVGAMFRTCDGAGVDGLILSGYTGTPPDRRIAKVALGAEEHVAWRSIPDDDSLLEALADTFVVVLEQDPGSVQLHELELDPESLPPDGVALVVCEELFGADDAILDRADVLLELPMRGTKHSLNVAMAAGIAMYRIADELFGTGPEHLASRQPARPVREGVLTLGVSTGEVPNRPTYRG